MPTIDRVDEMRGIARDRGTFTTVVAAAVLGVLSVVATAVVAAIIGVDHDVLTREPQRVLDGDNYVGATSQLGAVIWSIAFVVAMLAATVTDARRRQMFGAAALLSGALLADDLFLLHDAAYPKVGLGEELIQAIYFFLMAGIAVRFREYLGWTGVGAIVTTLGLFGLSALFDRWFNNSTINLDQLTEDGLKLVGIFVWSGLWWATARNELTARPDPAVTG